MKKLFLAGMIGLFAVSAFASDLHLAKHAGKASFKAAKFSAKLGFKAANKARKQLL